MSTSRRAALQFIGAGAASLWFAPQVALAASVGERRFVFIIQRGAADGLNTVIPCADPAYAGLRGRLAIDAGTAIKLDGTFALHPSLVQTAGMYKAGEALFVHALASAYRERSHFDGQNVLESGGRTPYSVKDGWLNRLVGLLPQRAGAALAFAPTVPLALRGTTEVGSYAPSSLPQATEDLLARVGQLYAEDGQLHGLWAAAMEMRQMADDGLSGSRQGPASLGRLAASFLVRPDGPRIAMIETGGWDTHSAQNPRLAARLSGMDDMLAALRDGLGTAWKHTIILIATEFGRTVATNGTQGTDHGTASVAWLVGGAVRGGRVITDWPGLGKSALQDGRDLRPTTQLDALLLGVAAEAFALDPARIAPIMLPTSPALRPMMGLLS